MNISIHGALIQFYLLSILASFHLVDSFTTCLTQSSRHGSETSSSPSVNTALYGNSIGNDSSNDGGGWKTRPVFPEIARSNSSGQKTQEERVPWDALRFVKQSSQFVTRPKIPFLEPTQSVVTVSPGNTIWRAGGGGDGTNQFRFGPLDDVVMGGASSSEFDNETGIWVGTVTSANSGGFVGIRSTPFEIGPLDMTGCTGLEIKLRSNNNYGADKRLKAVVRDSTEFNGVCWTTCFDYNKGGSSGVNLLSNLLLGKDTDTTTTTVRLPFEEQVPTIFARTVPDQTFNAANVVGFQLVYSKFEYDGALNNKFALGDFSLQLTEISAY